MLRGLKKMSKKNVIKTCAVGTGVSIACCFGLLSVIFGLLGLTAALAYVNAYGDYVFFPSFAIFGTIFTYVLLRWKKTGYNYVLAILTAGIAIWFMTFGLVYAGLILAGIIAGGLITISLYKRGKC